MLTSGWYGNDTEVCICLHQGSMGMTLRCVYAYIRVVWECH